MEEVLEQVNHWLQQAWVYIPAILSFITAIGVPALVQVAKIVASAKLYLTQTKVLMSKVNQCVDTIDAMADYIQANIQNEIEYNKQLLEVTYNPKQKQIIENRIAALETRQANDWKLEAIKVDEIKPKKKVKVKVVKK